jgi:uncharacterized protein
MTRGPEGSTNMAAPDLPNKHFRTRLKEVDIDGISYVVPTGEQAHRAAIALSMQIQDAGFHPDWIVPIATGAYSATRTLMDHLKQKGHENLVISGYDGEKKLDRPRIVEPLTKRVDGKKVLIFDEVIDTGETIQVAEEEVERMGAGEIKVATLCYKPRAEEITGVVPDFSVFHTNAWIVFPHELREFIDGKAQEWLAAGLPVGEIRSRLLRLGLPGKEISRYLTIQAKEHHQQKLRLAE